MVQWEHVRIPGKESVGGFTFQVALYKTGTITFSYRDVRNISALCSYWHSQIRSLDLIFASIK